MTKKGIDTEQYSEDTNEESCEFCGLKENCNNYKLGIEQGKTTRTQEILDIIDEEMSYDCSIEEYSLLRVIKEKIQVLDKKGEQK